MNSKWWRENSLLILRAVALILLVILAAKPVVNRPEKGSDGGWAVMIDTSKSMRVKDPTMRLDEARKVVETAVKHLDRRSLFQFSDDVAAVKPEELPTLRPAGTKSDIAGAIRAIGKSGARAGLLISDGRNISSGDPISEAASASRPLLVVGVGDKSLFRDVAVRAIQSPPFAFKNVATSLSATVSAVGFSGKSLVVKLTDGERILSLQNVQIQSPEFETTVTFSWTPTAIGSRRLSVEASPLPDEITTVNNRKDVQLDVGRDRFRVLYICGYPGPEYGFLRYQFKSDPAVELVTFVILRNAQNVMPVADAELSLIPFPSAEMLINQMQTFDLVVFEEFAYREFGLDPALLLAVRRRVEDGGSFLLMGGPTAFGSESQYALSGIQEMIPVQFGTPDVTQAKGAIAMHPRIPNHPVMRLDDNAARNEELWKKLPALEDVTLVPSAKPGASVLMTANVGGKEYPVLTVWRQGRGRVAALTTRTTWRWSLVSAEKELGSFVYQQFWKNMVLWLTHSDEYKTVRVGIEGKEVKLGDVSTARVWVYDEYFKPVSDADVKLELQTPDHHDQTLQAHAETTGVFVAPFTATALGEHHLRAWVTRNGRKYGEDTLRFTAVESQLEDEDLRPDFATLKDVAQASGGRFVTAKEFSPEVIKEFNQQVTEKVGKKVLLWNSPWLFAAVFIFLALEWFLRKRRDLP